MIIHIFICLYLFLLHIYKKNVLLLPIPIEVAFCVKILYPSLQDSIFQQSIWEKLFKWSED